MSRQTRFPALDHEPKAIQGPPPAYRTGSATVTDIDAWSQYSDSSGLGRRRASWSNLVESDENLNKHKVNCYPKVHAPFKNQALTGSASMISTVQHHPSSRTSSQMGVGMEGYYQGKGAMPVFADPSGVPPAGSIQYSRPPSKTPSMAHILENSSDLPAKSKRNRLQECNAWCRRPVCAFCLLLTLVIAIIGTVLAIVLTQVLIPPKNLTMSWLPPEILRTSQSAPSKVIMTAEGNQVRMQLQGAPPFKGNYVNYYDFKANRVVVIDESLKTNGKNIACFVMPLDRSNLQSELDMRKAANAGKKRTSQSQGWGEQWTWISSPLLTPPVMEPPILECEGVRWIQLDYISTNQQNRKCSECHDFCLPDYGIEKDQVRDENYMNILRRNCFYLFVPEWRSFAQSHSLEQNQRDFEQYYRNRNHITTSYGGPNVDPKWIPLAIPQQIVNTTRQVASGVMNSVTGTVDHLKSAVFGQSNNNQNQGGYGQQGYNNMDGSLGGNPGNNGVAGVVNLHGVNGNNGVNMYNMASQQNMMNHQQQQQQQQHQQNSQMPEAYRSYPNSAYPNNNNNGNSNNNGDQMNQNQQASYQMSGFGANPNFNVANQNSKVEPRSGYVPDVAPVSNQPSYQQTNNPYSSSNAYSSNMAQNNNNLNNNNNNNGYNNPANPVISSSYSIAVGENGRPTYPDQSGVNPPSGYIPQVAQQVNTPMQQGVAGMALPSIDTSGRHTGYTPDIVNQQMQQQAPPGGRWIAAG